MVTNTNESVGVRLEYLSIADRCDRCSAQAYVTVALLNGNLMFCAHDFHEFEVSLRKAAVGLLDERDLLLR